MRSVNFSNPAAVPILVMLIGLTWGQFSVCGQEKESDTLSRIRKLEIRLDRVEQALRHLNNHLQAGVANGVNGVANGVNARFERLDHTVNGLLRYVSKYRDALTRVKDEASPAVDTAQLRMRQLEAKLGEVLRLVEKRSASITGAPVGFTVTKSMPVIPIPVERDPTPTREPHRDTDAYECNDSSAQPADLSTFGQQITDLSVGALGDPADWFKWTAATSGTLIVTVSENGNGALAVNVWDASAQRKLTTPSRARGVHRFSIQVGAGRDYLISVTPVRSSNSNYTLKIDGTAHSGLNTVPVASTCLTLSTQEATQGSVTLLAAADVDDPDGDPLSLKTHSDWWGRATISGSSISYLPGTSITSFHSFTYIVDDSKGGRAKGRVFVFISPLSGKKAFPEALGFGAQATGGWNIYAVTHLGDTGPGSLRAGLSKGSHIIVFTVSGVIRPISRLDIPSDVTIAGETAPGEGITIYGGNMSSPDDLVRIEGKSNVIVRFVRFRSKDFNRLPGQIMVADSLSIHQAQKVIIDHCSLSWGNDGTIDVTNSDDVTVQWSIIAETLLPHSKGCLVHGTPRAGDITFHHNLFISNEERNAQITAEQVPVTFVTNVEFINNVVFNWDILGTPVRDGARAHVMGNFYKSGPSTSKPQQASILYRHAGGGFYEGNGFTAETSVRLDQPSSARLLFPGTFGIQDVDAADSAFSRVVGNDSSFLSAGASLVLDKTDRRLLAEAKSEPGTSPSLKSSIPADELP